ERLAWLVIGYLFIKGGTDALRDTALHLAVYDHRVNHRAAVFRHHIIEYFGHPIVGIHRHDGRVGAVCKNAAGISWLVGSGRFEQRIHTRRQMIRPGVRREGDLRNADLGRRAMHHSTLDASVRDTRLQQMCPDAAYFFSERARGFAYSAACEHDRPGSERAESIWSNRSI